ncbi:hypothetical protein HYV79_01000 [Candidatus Woesearchaeota archaeon]|nr:hypothetical protein [Candidatus Woesearchaeota archaeon]
MMDIVFPNNNENEFLDMAEKLSIKKLIFAYTEKSQIKKIKDVKTAFLCDAENVDLSRKYADFTIVKSAGNDRFSLERAKPDFMFGFEEIAQKDSLHQRASGLNQVLCSIASRNKINILFNFNIILKASEIKRALFIGRMMQNSILCKKYKVPHAFVSFAHSPKELRSPKDLESFFSLLGITQKLDVYS